MRGSSLLSAITEEAMSMSVLVGLTWLSLFPVTQGVTYTPVASSNLDLSQLGRVALAGDFDAISLYSYDEQTENAYNTNGSQAILSQLPNGVLSSLAATDARINIMCPFLLKSNEWAGVIVGGNFTSLDGTEAQGIALFNPNTTKVTPLSGLSGQVDALLCDHEQNTVYVGGEFKGANSTNAIAWVGTSGWANMPFAGFNGPVNSIVKAPSGHIIFGGSFTGLGNTTTPSKKNQQVINLSTANITSTGSSSTSGFSSPSNIICKTDGTDGSGDTWLLEDDTAGSWTASMNFGYTPTKLRLWNTHQDSRGAKTFRFTATPIDGIMNLTYTDPSSGENKTCDARCPLTNDSSVTYQDFTFVNSVGMSGFRIDISDWYGSGGGLNGIELFEDDIYAYAINDFNEPSCAVSDGSNSTTTGSWTVSPSLDSNSEYLVASLDSASILSESNSVVFEPHITQSGNYTVTMYTPGCIQDGTCESRSIVNVTGTFTSSSPDGISTLLYQTNDYDKYDQIYTGYVDASSSSFRPSVTLIPSTSASENSTFVAQRIRFQLVSSTGGLNGIYEYNPNDASTTTDTSSSVFDQAGTDLNDGATINTMYVLDDTTYISGSFSGSEYNNIFSISSGKAAALSENGLNSDVMDMVAYGNLLFLGGNFTATSEKKTTGLNNVAQYDTSSKTWKALGAGVNGPVTAIVPLLVNITKNTPETVIFVNGHFNQIQAFSGNSASSAQGIAIWVPSKGNWLQNLDLQTIAISGQLSYSTNLTWAPDAPLFAGSISSQALDASDVVSLSGTSSLVLSTLSVDIEATESQTSSLKKRATAEATGSGAFAGLFYESGSDNYTVLGGHFTAEATNGSTINNLAIINGSSDTVTGIYSGVDTNSTFRTLALHGSTLFAGGTVTGQIDNAALNGLVIYDITSGNFVGTQSSALSGDNVSVNAIAVRPNTGEVYVGGSFDGAGSLSCPGICMYQTTQSQWNRPGALGGNVSSMAWTGKNTLVAGGDLTINGVSTMMATYNAKKQTWAAPNSPSTIPGPITALTAASTDSSQAWIAGQATNGSAFLLKYDGSSWHSAGNIFGTSTTIRGLQVLSLTKTHSSSSVLDSDKSLLVTGQLNLPDFGNASAALFNGTTLTPFILSTTADNEPGSLSQLFSQQQYDFSSSAGSLSTGAIVAIALACALGCMFVLIAVGFILFSARRKREGYMPAPTAAWNEKRATINRVPPEQLFQSLGNRTGDVPML
ncbi:MAG: hypothetical protein M1834_001696 [Cirrosporium novae-zelandiae]|nr:MAG: hypothetical protein M1834_001696 [Cirrosporium novae-zelandiae]